ncbi:MAG: YbaY family lipoprotein [Vicinamibacterales bacterium]
MTKQAWWCAVLALACLVPSLPAHGQATVTGAPAPDAWSPRVDYECGEGVRVPVWYEGRRAIVFIDGRLERLPSVRSGSGARYSDGRRDWFTKGTEGMLSAAGQTAETRLQCRVAGLSSWRPAHAVQHYQCADGLTVEVAARLEAAAITFRGETHQMREVPVANGNLYTDGVRAWRGRADARQFAEAEGDAVFARGCHPASPVETAVLTGTVAYRTRQALPAGAVVEVRLVDVSRADAPADVVARQVLVTKGEQVPVPFSVTYAPGSLESGRRYAMQATIAIDNRVRFRSTTLQVVAAGGTDATPTAIVVQPVR